MTTFEKYIIDILNVNRLLQGSVFHFLSYHTLIDENPLVEAMEVVKNKTYKRQVIDFWNEVVNNQRDLNQEDFFNFFLYDFSPDAQLIMFSDEGALYKKAFQFMTRDFYAFSSQYEERFSMEFFQLSYYAIISLSDGVLRFIDELGGINEYKMLS